MYEKVNSISGLGATLLTVRAICAPSRYTPTNELISVQQLLNVIVARPAPDSGTDKVPTVKWE